MAVSFLKLMNNNNTLELIKKPNLLALITLVAIRAKRTNDISVNGLEIGEAFIGDHKSCGLSPREYRTAKDWLSKLHLVGFKTTNKGTVAKLMDKRIFDINEDASDKQTTSQRQTNDKQETTNKKVRRVRSKKEYKEKSLLHTEVEKICTSLSVNFSSLPETFTVYESRYSPDDIKKKAEDACVWIIAERQKQIADPSYKKNKKFDELEITRLAFFLRDCPKKSDPKTYKTEEQKQAEFESLVPINA